jgi:lysophospholipase L1-like esterase
MTHAMLVLIVCLLGVALANIQQTTQKNIVAIGDSWTVLGSPILQTELSTHSSSYNLSANGRSGSTASEWQNDVTGIQTALAATPSAELVWLSIGGNDIIDKLEAGETNPLTALSEIQSSIQSILDTIFQKAPNIKVVHFGYDLPNFSASTLSSYGKSVSDVNTFMFLFAAMLQTIAEQAKYKDKFYYVNMYGTLQAAAGISGAPVIDQPSPTQYMADSIHPNTQGFTILMQKFYNVWLGAQLSGSTTRAPNNAFSTKGPFISAILLCTVLSFLMLLNM